MSSIVYSCFAPVRAPKCSLVTVVGSGCHSWSLCDNPRPKLLTLQGPGGFHPLRGGWCDGRAGLSPLPLSPDSHPFPAMWQHFSINCIPSVAFWDFLCPVQWLRLHLQCMGVQVLHLGQRAKIPHASWPKTKNT